MRVGGDFASVSALQLKVRAQARRIEELESGGAYAAEVGRRRLQREYESRVRSLEREVADLGRLNAKMIRGWWETCEMVRREGEEAAADAMRAARVQEERALRAERARDGLADEVAALKARVAELEAELEELRGMNSKLTAQVRRDFENSSVPSSKQVVRRKKERTLPMWPEVARELSAFTRERGLGGGDYVFAGRNVEHMSRSGVRSRIDAIARRAAAAHPQLAGKRISAHVFRHSCAMSMLDSGVDLSTIAIWLGHENVQTTHKYMVADMARKEVALSKVHPGETSEDARVRYKPRGDVLDFLMSL